MTDILDPAVLWVASISLIPEHLSSKIEALWLEGEPEDERGLAVCSLPWDGSLPRSQAGVMSLDSNSMGGMRGISGRNTETLLHRRRHRKEAYYQYEKGGIEVKRA